MNRFLSGTLLLGACLLSGCASVSGPAPQLISGHYYMTGDSNCTQGKQVTDTQIMCADSQGNATGYRTAMTNLDMQMYQGHQAQARAEHAALNRQLSEMGQTFQQAGQQSLQQSQSWSAPTVQGIPSQGQVTGYNQAGSTLIGTDGTACQDVGGTIICR